MQLAGRLGEAPAFCNGLEVPHLAQIRGAHGAECTARAAPMTTSRSCRRTTTCACRSRHPALPSPGRKRSRKETAMSAVTGGGQHHEVVDVTTSKRPKVLMVVANPRAATTPGW